MYEYASCGDGLVQADVEDCDDEGESAVCNVDCTASLCGDGKLNLSADEACDDGNELNDDGCVAECVLPTCGDGFVHAGEEACDDGNLVDGDGCSATCEFEPLGKIFLTSSNGTPGFHGYDIGTDTWSTLTSPPAVTQSQLTNDGQVVYMMGSNNTVYEYDIDTDAWSDLMPGPGALTSQPIAYFQSVDESFYYLKDGQSTMYVYRDGAWTDFALGTTGSSAGTWDQATGELYIRTYSQLGFQVIDTSDDSIVRTIVNLTGVGENSRTGSYWNGHFYARTFTGTIQRLDAIDGTTVDTLAQPVSSHTGTDTDFSSGLIYISGYGGAATSFQVFDPSDDSISNLANQPAVSNHSTITVMRVPQ